MRFRLLGPLRVWDGAEWAAISAARQRAALAVLLLSGGRVVSRDRIVDELWGDEPPATAVNAVQGYVVRLRRLLDDRSGHRLATRAPGYQLVFEDGDLDAMVFEKLLESGRDALAEGRLAAATEQLSEALGLWRGPALGDVPRTPLVAAEATRFEQLRLTALQARMEAELGLGRHNDVAAELARLVAEHPLDERLRGQLMVALYRCGRRAEALDVYRQGRAVLADELGLDPGPELQRIEQAVLVDDPALQAGTPGRVRDQVTVAAPVAAPRPAPAPPPAPLPAPVPAQLPADVADFTGRDQHLAQLDALLSAPAETPGSTPAVVVVAGTAGVGKTALAVRWAWSASASFPDGQLYVNLRGYGAGPPLRPVEALGQVLRALGVPAERVPVDTSEAASLYRSLLADRRVLVLLDDAHSPDQVRPLLPGSAGCRTLVTSRDRLSGLVARDGARRLTLGVLTAAEAQDLLSRIVGADRVRAEPAATAELARVCARLPLALRIAAAQLADSPHRRIADYLTELAEGNRVARLAVDGDEQTAVRAVFDTSYAALAPEARRLFRLLGLVPGPHVTLDAAAALTGGTPSETAQSLDRLTGAHLLDQPAPGRYACHDLLRHYARERVGEEESDEAAAAAAGRLLDWYLRMVDAAARLLYPEKLRLPYSGPTAPAGQLASKAQALAWLDSERPNLVAAARHAAEHGRPGAAAQLADALRGYFWLRIDAVDWQAVAHAGRRAARVSGDPREEFAAELSLADLCWHQARYEPAIAHSARAVELSRQAGWPEGEALVMSNLGLALWRSGRLRDALDRFEQSLALARATGWHDGLVAGLCNLAAVRAELGQLDQAAGHFREALSLAGATALRAGALDGLGEVCHALGRLDRALDHLTDALAYFRQTGNRGGEADALRNLAAVHRDAGRYRESLDCARAALDLARETGSALLEAGARCALAATQERVGEHQAALDEYKHALHIAEESGIRNAEAVALLGLAAVHHRDGDGEAALAHARRALTLVRAAGFRALEADALTAIANVQLSLGEATAGAETAAAALAVHRETGSRLGQARSLLVLGQARSRVAGTDAALPHLRDALALFEAVGAPEAGQVRSLIA